MSIDGVSFVSSISAGATVSTSSQELDSDDFMNLLMVQLQNQDPSSPMDTSEMMTQQTQLATVSQLTALNTTMQEQFALSMRVAALGMLGAEVSYTDGSGEVVSGTAESASFEGGVPTVTVGGEEIPLDYILSATQGA
ncbi:flagellar hook capping FlgD N-terminal domain-containing protein [Demequina mangrovi]|uniref:Flagellar basal-body rod modification protein FlgD n=1 Tax=Demequina mangrovi TaxID=1043493 RepID=A0A1H7A285_9MICO|nr:flagellar hook capping FlgD N-terminal domain-containing protein [Demequina mangrovi]SEJ56142.1 flagellar basal-body rod modification protein FlgD [Demequina mangrovi]